MRTGSAGTIVAGLAAFLMVSTTAPAAQADTPLGVAAIGAVGLIGAATITAAGTIGAAVITANGNSGGTTSETTTDGDGGGTTTSESGGGTASGGSDDGGSASESNMSVGEDDLDPKVRGYIDRAIDLSVKQLAAGAGAKTAVRLNYNFKGDVRKADKKVASFKHKDAVAWDLKVKKSGNPVDYVAFNIKEIKLSTEDVPKTDGFSQIVLQAFEGKTKVWTWKARVNQGKKPVFDPVSDKATVKQSKDNLHITGFQKRLKVSFPPGKNTRKVTLVMKYTGRGARL